MAPTRVRIRIRPEWSDPVIEAEIDGKWWPLTTEHKPWVLDEGVVVLSKAPDDTDVVVYPSPDDPLRIPNAIRSRALSDLVRVFERDGAIPDLVPDGPPIDLPPDPEPDPSIGE